MWCARQVVENLSAACYAEAARKRGSAIYQQIPILVMDVRVARRSVLIFSLVRLRVVVLWMKIYPQLWINLWKNLKKLSFVVN